MREATKLVGRDAERAALAAHLKAARAGRGACVVLHGEAGVGKSSLIADAVGAAKDFQVLRCRGVEAEVELPFSGLHELLFPVLHEIDDLPGVQAAALRSALALQAAAPASVVTASMATLALIASIGANAPILVVVDDVHWMDDATLLVLAFVARRIGHDRILMLMAARDDEVSKVVPGERIAVGPLSPVAAKELAGQLLDRPLASGTIAAVLRATAGNPLAVIETLGLGADELDRLDGTMDAPPPPGEMIERAFSGRVDALSEATRDALLVVATALSESAELIAAACSRLGLPERALSDAEEAGVLHRHFGQLAFSHPLLRALVFHRASPAAQRASHSALAEVASERASKAWHAASASRYADEVLAANLADVSDDFQARGGLMAAAQALERAARLTPEQGARVNRLAAAARAARFSGRWRWALSLLDDAQEAAGSDRRLQVRVESERLPLQAATGSNADLLQRQLQLARKAATLGEDAIASLLFGMAANEGLLFGRMDVSREALAELRAKPLPTDPALLASIENDEMGVLAHSGEDPERLDQLLSRLVPGSRTYGGLANAGIAEVLLWFERDEEADQVITWTRQTADEDGDLYSLGGALWVDGYRKLRTGEWAAANVALDRALQISETRDIRWVTASTLAMLSLVRASAGAPDALGLADRVDALSRENAYHFDAYTLPARGIYHLAVGEPEAAVRVLESAVDWHRRAEHREPCALTWPVDVVEAQLLVGDRTAAEASFMWFRERVEATGRRLGAAMVSRLEGMLADDDHYDAPFASAIAAHRSLTSPFELARTHLHYGQRLRRSGQPTRAQQQLLAAEQLLERLGAVGWLAQTRHELEATGLNIDGSGKGDVLLTSQETVVADLVAQGLTNKQVAAELFLTPKTIEWHLRQIYRKLGITSRTQLAAWIHRGHA